MATVKVADATRRLVVDGWVHVRTTGSHRHYRHPTKSGVVTIPGKLRDTLAEGAWNSIQKQAGWR